MEKIKIFSDVSTRDFSDLERQYNEWRRVNDVEIIERKATTATALNPAKKTVPKLVFYF